MAREVMGLKDFLRKSQPVEKGQHKLVFFCAFSGEYTHFLIRITCVTGVK